MRIANCVTSLAFLAFSILYYFSATALPFSPSYGDPGPAELPKLVAIIVAVVAVVLFIHSIRDKATEAVKVVFSRKGAVFLLWSLLAALALPYFHAPATLAVYIFGGVLIQTGRKGLLLAVVCAPVITGFIYALFELLLGVTLP